MKILGIEFSSNVMAWLSADAEEGKLSSVRSGRIALDDTRKPKALAAFRSAAESLLRDASPDVVALKEKPENGRLRAGSAALKMEALLLAAVACRLDVVSGRRANQCGDPPAGTPAWLSPAWKAAAAAMEKAKA